jgi:primosomal protein N''
VDEARAVLTRLERIAALEREGAPTASLLAELRELVREATLWAERERDPRARRAAAELARAEREHDGRVHARDARQTVLPSVLAARSIE